MNTEQEILNGMYGIFEDRQNARLPKLKKIPGEMGLLHPFSSH